MIGDLKPYAMYKHSGIPWLGELPEHWEVYPSRALFTEVKERNQPNKEMLSVTINKGVIKQKVFLSGSSKKDSANQDKSAYKLVRSGEIVYNKMRAWQGAVGVSLHLGIVSPAYVVVRLRDSHTPWYFHYLLRTPAFAKEAERWSYGITSDQWSLRPEHFKMIYCSVPPRDEQSAIVRFLSHADQRIQRYIRAKKKLIALLNEQRQAIIQRAVTRGLDPDVRLKPSGVEWLGEVPEHWKIVRLKDVATVQTGLTLGKNYQGVPTTTRPYLRVANVQDGRLDLGEVKYIDVPSSEVERSTLRCGDVLMTEGGDIDKLGRGCVWNNEIPRCLHQNHLFAVRCQLKSLIPEFLVSLMASLHGRAYFQRTAKQTTNLASTNSSTLRAFPVVLPPIKEQDDILGKIAKQAGGLDTAITHAEREIVLLHEYRIRLIADVVTGKLDVREAVARLPEEAEEPEVVDESEAMGENEADGLDEVSEEAVA